MALNWDFKKNKLGTCTHTDARGQKFELRLYDGNAFVIALHENDEEDTYSMVWFFVDELHAKNCMGMSKDYEECFKSFSCDDFVLDLNKKNARKLAELLIKAKYEVKISMKDIPPFKE